MQIRSTTWFLDTGTPADQDRIAVAGRLASRLAGRFADLEIPAQTRRLATPPFPRLLKGLAENAVVDYAVELERIAADFGFAYVALGPATPEHLEAFDLITPILEATGNVFLSGSIASRDSGISPAAIRACAGVIHRAARIEPNGFGNLYFTASANVVPGGPFFPAAYHDGDRPAFALAMEAADLIVDAASQATSLQEAFDGIVGRLEAEASRLAAPCQALATEENLDFIGFDFSPAPFPEKARSLGTAFERLGVPAIGRHGSLAAAALIAAALDRARYPKAGFNGLMLPLLEDFTLATRAAQGTLRLKDLLMYSAVCGTGLDTVPLPGDITRPRIAAILFDVAALSQRLRKPLTARLMPIPGKRAGDPTEFDFPYFENSVVLDVEADPLTRAFLSDEPFDMNAFL